MHKYLLLLLFIFVTLRGVEYSSPKTVISYFKDSNTSYTIEEVIHKQKTLFTTPLLSHSAHFPPRSTLWLKIEQENLTNTTQTSILQFLDIRLDKMSVYTHDAKLIQEVGDRFPYINRHYKDAQIAIDIKTKPLEKTTLFIKFWNEDKSDLSYILYEEKAYFKELLSKKIIESFFFGALLIMLLYNFVFYLFLREKTFLIYLMYHVVLLLVMLYYNGLVSQYFYPSSYNMNGGNVPVLLIYLSVILAIEFLRNFLYVAKYTPKLDKILFTFIVLNVMLFIVHPFDILHKHISTLIMIPMSLFLIFVSAYHAFVLKRKIALFFLIGWLGMLLAIILTAMLSFGLIERNNLTAYSFQVGIILEITLLSMGLAYRYKLNQDELNHKTKFIYEQSKLASMGEMLQNISHQWRQPLSEINAVAMKLDADFYKERVTKQTLESDLQRIEDITLHMSDTIESFNSYFKKDKEFQETNLEEVTHKTLNILQDTLKDVQVKVVVNDSSKFSVNIGELTQVILIILNNAVDALILNNIENKTITITITKVAQKHILEIEDNAGGIKEENLHKIFELYFTTKFKAEGIGVGLYMAKMLIEERLEGVLEVSNYNDGARFRITL